MNDYGAVIGNGAIGFFNSLINNIIAAQREEAARIQNYELNEKAAQNADKRTRKLYWDIQSPQAMIEQYKAAGLSPSLMAQGGGIGAQPSAGAQGSGAGGISPNTFGMSQLDLAQLKLINAQAEKTEAEANVITGENERGRAEIDALLQEVNNKWLDGEVKALDVELKNIDYAIKAATGETEIQIKERTLENLVSTGESIRASLRSLIAKGRIDEESANSIIEFYRQRVIEQEANIILKRSQNALNQSGIALNETQIQKLLNDIVMDKEAVRQRGEEIEINREGLQARIDQWAKENGLTKREQNIKIGDIIYNGINSGRDRATGLIEALIPFAQPIRKVKGL